MKKTFIALACSAILFIAFTTTTLAQTNFSTGIALRSIAGSHAEHSKVLENFSHNSRASRSMLKYITSHSLDNATIKWQQLNENTLGTFSRGASTTNLLFNKFGKLVYSIDFITENELGSEVKRLMKENYWNYDVTTAARLAEAGRTVYVVKLEGKKDYVTVAIEDGDIRETEHYFKSRK